MPCDYSLYPPNWKSEIRPRILARAKNRCEVCGAKNGAHGYRDKSGGWWDFQKIDGFMNTLGVDLFEEGQPLRHLLSFSGKAPPPTKIVLTIAHWHDKDPMNCADENLKAACQYCHINHDKQQHITNARLTRERKAGLQRMF